MSDEEESFVILGTSPMPSLTSGLEQDGQEIEQPQDEKEGSSGSGSGAFNSLRNSQIEKLKSATCSPNASLASNDKENAKGKSLPSEVSATGLTESTRAKLNGSILTESTKANEGSLSSTHSGDGNLAASFIMGEIGADVLKTSVYSQFPSLCSMEACAEDVVKLQNLMTEYVALKNTLSKVNTTMKQFYVKTTEWKEDMLRMEQQYKQQLLDCQTQIATLRNENLELKRQVESNASHFKCCEVELQKEHTELIQTISEKTAQMENMRIQIDKLEQQQLASFEYLPKHEHDTKEQPDYVDRLEHQRVVKDFERKMSVLLAENLECKDMQKQYIDEINCLKVNYTAAEELIKQMRADISMLQAKDMSKTEEFANYERERDQMREEIALLRQQIDVYSRDFVMERDARQNLAGDKDQLLQDLRALQRRNQELIEEQQRRCEANVQSANPVVMAAVAASAAATNVNTASPLGAVAGAGAAPAVPPAAAAVPTATSKPPESYSCPICGKTSDSLTVLQDHVNYCLDSN